MHLPAGACQSEGDNTASLVALAIDFDKLEARAAGILIASYREDACVGLDSVGGDRISDLSRQFK